MKKRILSLLLCCVMLLGMLPTVAFAEGSTAPADITGTGTVDDAYRIYTAEGLKEFRNKVNNGEIDALAKLMNDIDLGGEPWTPIANYTGTFDGNGKNVSGLNVKDVQYAGLFGTLNDATVKNVAVTGYVAASGTGTNAYAGAIAAYATGSTAITGCKSYATVTTTTAAGEDVSVTYAAYAGGTVGYTANSVALTDCVNNGTVLSTIRNNDDFSVQAYIGGIAGMADGNVRFGNCVNNGALSTDCKSAESNIGGIVGCAIGGAVIADCQNNGAVTGAVDHSEDPDIYYMFYTTGSNAGGIVGYGVAIRITGCCNAGAIRADSTGNYVGSTNIGGIAGYILSGVKEAVITDCSNVATVTGTNTSSSVRAGGIVGFVNADGTDVSFTNCYSTGAVSAASQTSKIEIGGIAGQIIPSDKGGDIVIDNCCWLNDTVESAVGSNHKGLPVNASSKSAADFANGAVLDLLKNNRTDSPWDVCGYLEDAGMMVPLLEWQTRNARKYGIFIKSVQITSLNQNDVLGDGTVSFVYDEENEKGILTLDGFRSDSNIFYGEPIGVEMANLEIVLKGENRIETTDFSCITAVNLTFSGDGSIELGTDSDFDPPVYCKAFTVNGGNVKISSTGYAYALRLSKALTVNGGMLELISKRYSALDTDSSKLQVILGDDRIMITGIYSDGSDASVTDATDKVAILSAKYIKILNKYIPVTYDPGQYGTGSAVTQTKTYGVNFGLADAKFTRIGYKQVGWALSDGGDKTYELGSAYTGNEPMTLYPVWEVEQYSINYDLGGGTITGNPEHYTVESESFTLQNPGRDGGYEFAGWSGTGLAGNDNMTVTVPKGSTGSRSYKAHWRDIQAPIVNGLQDGKIYCSAVEFTVSDNDGDALVLANGVPIQAENGKYKLLPAQGEQKVIAKDSEGNSTEITVIVNDGHTYEWQSENGEYWQKCKFCNHETAKKDIPTINISGAENVCRTQSYTFTFTFSQGVADAYYGYEFLGLGGDHLAPAVDGASYSGKINATAYPAEENSFKLVVSGETADGFVFSVEKTVTIQNEHTGGTATCTDKAICEICGENYGELDVNNHSNLKHVKEKKATESEEGNIEYWHCLNCNKYFTDASAKNEVVKADIVTSKLVKEKNDDVVKTNKSMKSPQTGDNVYFAFGIAVLFLCGVMIIFIYNKKKKSV